VGLRRVETFLASGNLVFEGGESGEAALRRRLEAHLRGVLGYEVATFLRSAPELAALVKGCPFEEAEVAAAKALSVAFLHDALTPEGEARLQALSTEVDAFRLRGREVWWLCLVRQSESTFSHAVFERTLQVKATFRGVSTLVRLATRHQDP
jgi:uncharacterized protein (DUF1697 family)